MRRCSIKKISFLTLFFIIGFFGVDTLCFAQQGRARVTSLTAVYPIPFAAYNIVRTKRIFDMDNNNYLLDPAGVSVLRDINIGIAGQAGARILMDGNNSAIFGNVALPGGGAKAHIKLNSTSIADPSIYVHSIQTTDRITMGAATPPNVVAGVPVGGKHIYDVAERMNVVDCQPGDVVVISEQEDLTFVKSENKFDTKVAGIFSENPKLLLGGDQGREPVALAGIVRCNVTAENGAIEKGDLLVTSSVAGHAMRADAENIQPGMVVGSALENLASGEGKIYVLVNQ